MTKVEKSYHLKIHLGEDLLGRLADAHKIYGIFTIRVEPSLDALRVEYDASRLGPRDVDAALARAGIPVLDQA